MKIHSHPSPNYNDRPPSAPVSMLVMHYTGMKTAKDALDRLCDPDAEVSSHYLIDEDGTTYHLVEEEKRAWHAGISHWRGKEVLNDISIGIEIVNPGHEHGYRIFPPKQMESVVALSQDIIKRYSIKPCHVVGHSDIAPDRKQDPGELFDWAMLAKHGIGLYSSVQTDNNIIIASKGDQGNPVQNFQQSLHRYGYAIPTEGYFCDDTEQAVIAFKRHFCPEALNEHWCLLANLRLDDLLSQSHI